MSAKYDSYLHAHRTGVGTGLMWLMNNLPELTDNLTDPEKWEIQFHHDMSKNLPDEYDAYDNHFYGINKSFAAVNAYKVDWLTHIHRNPHHWQYWILINDDPAEGTVVLEMPYRYVLEMVCDWWAFSWSCGDLHTMFTWWASHKDHIQLHPKTLELLETILAAIDAKLKENEEQK
jgi:hypothetical protein